MVVEMPEKVVYESPGGWVQIIETPNKFYYLRRKNRDSVAVFLIRRSNGVEPWEVLIRKQPLPLNNPEPGQPMTLFPCPITGGFDSAEEQPAACAKREALEEAGYRLGVEELSLLGGYIVGTQTDERVYMLWADVSNIEPEAAEQDGTFFEAVSKNEWMPLSFLGEQGGYSANQIGYLKLCQLLSYPFSR